jgi:ribosomal protein S18 acetylase RimI-like enzyme
MVQVVKLSETRWNEYRDLRLESLLTDSPAFGRSYDEELNLDVEIWKKRLNNTLFALIDEIPIGMISIVYQTNQKVNHIANIYSVYVKPEFRHQGIGKMLIDTAIKQIEANPNILKIRLNVNPMQNSAVNLYMKAGFQVVGKLKMELHVKEDYYDELIFEKFVKHTL